MKKILQLVFIFAVIFSMAGVLLAAPPDLSFKKRVAVADFTIRQNEILQGQDAWAFARTVTEKIINAFAELKRFSILDRTAVSQLQQEKQIQMLGYETTSAQANIGSVGKADIYCTGEVQNVSVSEKYNNKNEFLGYDGSIEIQIKLYDLSSGTLVLSKDVHEGGGLLTFFDIYKETPSEALLEALNNAESEIREAIEEAFPVEGKIAEVLSSENEQELFLVTLGSNLGFRKGDELMILEVSKLNINGASYIRQKEIGRLKITRPEPDGIFSEARVTGNLGQIIIKKYESGYNLVLRSVKR